MKGVSTMDGKQQKKPIISLEELLEKEHEFISSEDALRDVVPPQWSDDALSEKTKIFVGTKDEVL